MAVVPRGSCAFLFHSDRALLTKASEGILSVADIYIYMYVYVCIYVYIRMCVCIHVYACAYVYMRMCVCVYVYTASTRTYIYIFFYQHQKQNHWLQNIAQWTHYFYKTIKALHALHLTFPPYCSFCSQAALPFWDGSAHYSHYSEQNVYVVAVSVSVCRNTVRVLLWCGKGPVQYAACICVIMNNVVHALKILSVKNEIQTRYYHDHDFFKCQFLYLQLRCMHMCASKYLGLVCAYVDLKVLYTIVTCPEIFDIE